MDLIKRLGRRSRVSDVVYRLLNIVYAASLFLLVSPGVGLPYLAYLLVVLSKWRVFAVRPRFWFANLQANFIDFMVGISVVTLMILASPTTPWAGAMLAILFAAWLLLLKPHTAQRWMLVQAAVGQFIALMALFSLAHDFEFEPVVTDSSLLTVVLAWLIGYMTARHALSAFRGEEDRTMLSLVWGFVVAEIAWLAHHWTIAYPLFSNDLMIPHVAIFVTLLSVGVLAWYRVLHVESDKKAFADARSVTIFVVVVNVILIVWRYGLGDIASL